MESNIVLINHSFSKTYNANKSHQVNKSKEENKQVKENEETPEISFAIIEGKYYCCGKGGHKSPECQMKDKIPNNKWAMSNILQIHQLHHY
jgi:hypothetical protein